MSWRPRQFATACLERITRSKGLPAGRSRLRGAAMKRFLLLLLFASSFCVLDACSSGIIGPPPPFLTVSFSPNAVQALDVNQTISITANVSNDSSNQGVNWKVTCPAGGNACGGMTQSMSASGAPNKYVAPSNLSSAQIVTVIAASASDPTKSSSVQVTVNPALALVTPSPVQQQIANAGTPFSLNLMNFVQGGTAPFTWSITSGALPAGLTLNSATGTTSARRPRLARLLSSRSPARTPGAAHGSPGSVGNVPHHQCIRLSDDHLGGAT